MDIRKLSIKDFCKILFIASGMKTKEVAEKLGKTVENLSTTIRMESMSIKTFIDIIEACGETFVIEMKNGEKFEIEVKKK